MNEMFNFCALIGCVPWQKQMYFQNKIKHTVHLCKECNKWNWTCILVNNSDVKKVIKALPWIMQLFYHFSHSHFLTRSLCRWPQSTLTVNQPQIEILSCDSFAFIQYAILYSYDGRNLRMCILLFSIFHFYILQIYLLEWMKLVLAFKLCAKQNSSLTEKR